MDLYIYIYVEMRGKVRYKIEGLFVLQNLLDMVDFSEAKKMSMIVEMFLGMHNFSQISGPYSCALPSFFKV